jgi:signal peptidase I
VFAYMPSLYLAGLSDIVMLMVLSALVTLFVKRHEDARLLIFISAVILLVIKAVAGVYEILQNRVTMQNFGSLFDTSRSWYYPALAAIFIVCIAVTILRAQRLAKYYNTLECDADTLPKGVRVIHIDSITGRQINYKRDPWLYRYKRIFNAAVTALLILIITAALAFNVLIILMGTATPGNEVTIRGMIPYVFRSDTMQPSIMNNDLVFFHKIDNQHNVEEGQIVVFKDNNIVYIERIVEMQEDTIEVDIDHYPPAANTGAMAKEIKRDAIYGVYSGRSRWLGAFVLFANTIIGRILFLLVPAVLLFYRKRIAALYREKKGK